MITGETIIYALMGGILPALVWLSFWLQEDYKHPEPRKLLLKTFLFGMLAVPLVIPFQKIFEGQYLASTALTLLIWAGFEELFKFVAAYFGGLKSREDNEPLDPLVYMITAALGFAALENAMFLVEPLTSGKTLPEAYLITGNLRFIGASLLHIVSSGIIGALLAFSFYRSWSKHVLAGISGLIVAIAFHASFNIAIVSWGGIGLLGAFVGVWGGVIVLLLAFEKAKLVTK